MAGSSPLTAANGYSNPNVAPLVSKSVVAPVDQSYTNMMAQQSPQIQPVVERKGYGGK